jgi:hypothetical protein
LEEKIYHNTKRESKFPYMVAKKKTYIIKPLQWRGNFPSEDWQLDFTQVPKCQGYTYLLVYLDTLSGWIKALPTHLSPRSS